MSNISVNNYLVPAVGTPSAFVYKTTLVGGNPVTLEFRPTDLDGVNFVPSGVLASVDNASAVIMKISELGDFAMNILPGDAKNYPATQTQTLTLEGSGSVILVFVNYPIVS